MSHNCLSQGIQSIMKEIEQCSHRILHYLGTAEKSNNLKRIMRRAMKISQPLSKIPHFRIDILPRGEDIFNSPLPENLSQKWYKNINADCIAYGFSTGEPQGQVKINVMEALSSLQRNIQTLRRIAVDDCNGYVNFFLLGIWRFWKAQRRHLKSK